MIQVTHNFKANLDALEQIRNVLNVANEDIGLSKKKLYKLILAVDEIATNIINHGYIEEGISEGTFDLALEGNDKQLIVSLVDSAIKFDPLQHTVPKDDSLNVPLEERPIGGLGVMIALQSVDEYKYEYIHNKNRNIFIVNLEE